MPLRQWTLPTVSRKTCRTRLTLLLFLAAVLAVALETARKSGASGEDARDLKNSESVTPTEPDSKRAASTQSDLWTDVSEAQSHLQIAEKPNAYRVLELNEDLFDRMLAEAPMEFTKHTNRPDSVVSLPLPNGKLWRFKIAESPVITGELAAQFPEIKTYSGQSLDDPTTTVRFSWTAKGLNAFVIGEQGSFLVVPASPGDRVHYLSYFTHDLEGQPFECLTGSGGKADPTDLAISTADAVISNGSLRQYRLAVSVTPEFIFGVGGNTASGAITAVTNYVNNVRAIYEREIGVSFTLVVWNPAFFGAPLTNGNLQLMDQQNQFFLDNLFVPGFSGSNSYDIGFALGYDPSRPSGLVLTLGAGELGCACQPTIKAMGSALVPGPSTNDYWGSVVMAHEIGHMFGGRHTFTPTLTDQCEPYKDLAGRVEPGGGSTVMSYAGICGLDNLSTSQPHDSANTYFHVHSLERVRNHKAAFSTCGQTISTANSAPVITNSGTNATIPALTPFTLTAAATDPNGDAVTYSWEEWDQGGTIFRSFVPTSSGSRTFPSWTYILNNGNNPPLFVGGFFSGEALPPVTGTMHFMLTVRDNRSGGGGTTERDQFLEVNVIGTAGPFRVIQPNTPVSLTGGAQTTISWNVANTNFAPISTSAVRILLSTDGGNTFPTTLVSSTPNDGSQLVTLPNVQTNTARVKIEAVGNIYFDISDTNFAIGNATSNLVPYQHPDWSDRIVVSTSTGTNTDSSILRSSDTLFVDWAATNAGALPTSAIFFTKLYVDGIERSTWLTNPPLSSDFFISVQDFSIGSLSVGSHTVKIVLDTSGAVAESNESDNEYTKTIVVSAAASVQLSAPNYSVSEAGSTIAITVTRGGDTSLPATVKYGTTDATDVNFNCNPATPGQITGMASRKCDYHIAAGRLRFAPGETSKQIVLSLVNDVYVEPSEALTITLSHPSGATLGTPNSATVTITDNDTPGQANPIGGTAFYVRMLYVDLLSREPDPTGFAGWVRRIDFCGQPGEPPPPCDRVTVGGDGFLRSAEFFDREFFVIRLYRTALGRILRYEDVGDLAFVSGFLTSGDLELNKEEVVADIMSRPEFGNIYNSLNNIQYVDTLIAAAAVTLPAGVRDGWVNALNGTTKTRAQVFRELSERAEVSAKYLHEAQVVSCYYGFFTRNPDGAYFTFLQRYDNGEITLGDLANAFINAAEYRQRFGP